MRDCPWCTRTHGSLLLCEPARLVLDALHEQGTKYDMPTIELPEPVAGTLGPDTVLCVQIVAKAGTIPFAGVVRPVLVLSGRDDSEKPLPNWVTGGDADGMRRFAALVTDMTELAIRTAAGTGGGHG